VKDIDSIVYPAKSVVDINIIRYPFRSQPLPEQSEYRWDIWRFGEIFWAISKMFKGLLGRMQNIFNFDISSKSDRNHVNDLQHLQYLYPESFPSFPAVYLEY